MTNVGRAGSEELLADARDGLRVRDLPTWDKDSKQSKFFRELGRKASRSFERYRELVATRPPDAAQFYPPSASG